MRLIRWGVAAYRSAPGTSSESIKSSTKRRRGRWACRIKLLHVVGDWYVCSLEFGAGLLRLQL